MRSRCTPHTGTRPRSPKSKAKMGFTTRSLFSMTTCNSCPCMVPMMRSLVEESVEFGSQDTASTRCPLSLGSGRAWVVWKFKYHVSPAPLTIRAWNPLGSSKMCVTSVHLSRPKSIWDVSSSAENHRTTSPFWKPVRTLQFAAATATIRCCPPVTLKCSCVTGRAVKIGLSPPSVSPSSKSVSNAISKCPLKLGSAMALEVPRSGR
mmetsp:Transcript_42512/g.74609  ORF Transcript_42512/g.74609 Transcript_42512/m.74609 type:complete len:206 (-) Transcript_42512:5-622(-)